MLIDIHTHSISSRLSIFNLELNFNRKLIDGHIYSYGVHPWEASLENFKIFEERYLKLRDKVRFIGECGLDKLSKADIKTQRNIFENQLSIAQRDGKGVIIHCVRAYEEVYKILRDYKLKFVIFHDFYSSFNIAKKLIDRGYFLSMGKSIFRKNSKSLEFIRVNGLKNIFFETDMGEFFIEEIYNEVSKGLSKPLDQIEKYVYKSFMNKFEEL